MHDDVTPAGPSADATAPDTAAPDEPLVDETGGDEPLVDETIGASGHTLEQLSAYVDRGRTPRIAAIEDDAEARALLESMERLAGLARTMADEDAAAAGPGDEPWIESLLGAIRSEVRAGRDLTIEDPDALTSTTITEGALREMARTAGDAVDDTLVGRVHLAEHDGTLDVRITIGVRYGVAVVPVAAAVRAAVHHALATHAPLPIGAVDVVVDDVFPGGAS